MHRHLMRAVPTLMLGLLGCAGAEAPSGIALAEADAAQALQAAATCRSAYDNDQNNTFGSTHYFLGPMPIPFDTDISGLIEVQGDQDYYKFTALVTGRVTLTLSNLPADYHLRLVNSLGTTIATSARKGTADESIGSTLTAGAVYSALVYPSSRRLSNASACYRLRVATGP